MLGDERADKTKKKWGRPLKPILITDTGVLSWHADLAGTANPILALEAFKPFEEPDLHDTDDLFTWSIESGQYERIALLLNKF